jgi:hypothetical protein
LIGAAICSPSRRVSRWSTMAGVGVARAGSTAARAKKARTMRASWRLTSLVGAISAQ